MIERRRHQRYQFANGPKGTLRVADQVVIEELHDRAITVISSVPGRPGDVVTIDASPSSERTGLDALVDEAAPAIIDGSIRHRLRLRPVGISNGQKPQVVGGLQWSIQVRLLEMSEGGCLLDLETPVHHGAAAELDMPVDGEDLVEELRVCRCQLVQGAGPRFRVGCEFTTPVRNNRTSLRRWLRRELARGPNQQDEKNGAARAE